MYTYHPTHMYIIYICICIHIHIHMYIHTPQLSGVNICIYSNIYHHTYIHIYTYAFVFKKRKCTRTTHRSGVEAPEVMPTVIGPFFRKRSVFSIDPSSNLCSMELPLEMRSARSM
jgi:hypothetical protein